MNVKLIKYKPRTVYDVVRVTRSSDGNVGGQELLFTCDEEMRADTFCLIFSDQSRGCGAATRAMEYGFKYDSDLIETEFDDEYKIIKSKSMMENDEAYRLRERIRELEKKLELQE